MICKKRLVPGFRNFPGMLGLTSAPTCAASPGSGPGLNWHRCPHSLGTAAQSSAPAKGSPRSPWLYASGPCVFRSPWPYPRLPLCAPSGQPLDRPKQHGLAQKHWQRARRSTSPSRMLCRLPWPDCFNPASRHRFPGALGVVHMKCWKGAINGTKAA